MASLMQGQFSQMVDQLTKTVREVHLTVSWPEGSKMETLELVTHVVSLGPGGDRNGNLQASAQQAVGAATGQLDSNGNPIVPPLGVRGPELGPLLLWRAGWLKVGQDSPVFGWGAWRG